MLISGLLVASRNFFHSRLQKTNFLYQRTQGFDVSIHYSNEKSRNNCEKFNAIFLRISRTAGKSVATCEVYLLLVSVPLLWTPQTLSFLPINREKKAAIVVPLATEENTPPHILQEAIAAKNLTEGMDLVYLSRTEGMQKFLNFHQTILRLMNIILI